jgi:hypothetical protein
MVLQLAHAPSASARQSFPLDAPPQPRAVLSVAGVLVAPPRLLAPGSCAATWLRRPGSGTLAGKAGRCVGAGVDVRAFVGALVIVGF